ncbi:LysM peptidoglycan-binding domain-containing protein [candidate division WOR-3 bacterium]|nr:LysM peptidoglycan-binding domain-containing protein [candidate division WOR-3 bacterium]
MRYFLIAFLILCCFSFGLLAQEKAMEEEAMEEEVMEEEAEEPVMEEESVAGEALLADQRWTPAEADSLINALKAEEEDLKVRLADLQEQIDALQMEVSDMDTKIAEFESEKAELEEKLEQISWYKVKEGDYLCKIAERSEVYGYGKYARWKAIYNANKDKISDPNLIRAGWNLFIPRP